MATSVILDDLESAMQWASASSPGENSACISKTTGQIFYASDFADTVDELPEDIDDASLYWSVPHKNDLELGRLLVFRYVEEWLPQEVRTVQGYFHRRGAYARFKDLLHRTGHVDRWHEYERIATEAALLEWARENGLTVVVKPPRPGA
jgi:hypothetical protein